MQNFVNKKSSTQTGLFGQKVKQVVQKEVNEPIALDSDDSDSPEIVQKKNAMNK